MSNKTYGFDGFDELSKIIENYANETKNVVDILEDVAKEFVTDLLKLPKPISKIKKAGYTHLINTFSYKRKKDEVEAGWGKYYGPIVEKGSIKMSAQPHMYPLWDKNKEKYYKKMLSELGYKN